jgi:hypothetical protein
MTNSKTENAETVVRTVVLVVSDSLVNAGINIGVEVKTVYWDVWDTVSHTVFWAVDNAVVEIRPALDIDKFLKGLMS